LPSRSGFFGRSGILFRCGFHLVQLLAIDHGISRSLGQREFVQLVSIEDSARISFHELLQQKDASLDRSSSSNG
jgi:hypothetical protein